MVKPLWYACCATSAALALYLFCLLCFFDTHKAGHQSIYTNLAVTLQWAAIMAAPVALAYFLMARNYSWPSLLLSAAIVLVECYMALLLYQTYFINKDY